MAAERGVTVQPGRTCAGSMLKTASVAPALRTVKIRSCATPTAFVPKLRARPTIRSLASASPGARQDRVHGAPPSTRQTRACSAVHPSCGWKVTVKLNFDLAATVPISGSTRKAGLPLKPGGSSHRKAAGAVPRLWSSSVRLAVMAASPVPKVKSISSRAASLVEVRWSSGGTISAMTVNLKAWMPLITYETFRRKADAGSSTRNVTSNPADAPEGMTCDGGHDSASSGSSAARTSTKTLARRSLMTLKERDSVVPAVTVPKSMVLGPPTTASNSLGESGCLHSRTSSGSSGSALNLRTASSIGSNTAARRPAPGRGAPGVSYGLCSQTGSRPVSSSGQGVARPEKASRPSDTPKQKSPGSMPVCRARSAVSRASRVRVRNSPYCRRCSAFPICSAADSSKPVSLWAIRSSTSSACAPPSFPLDRRVCSTADSSSCAVASHTWGRVHDLRWLRVSSNPMSRGGLTKSEGSL
mmetsp:Transcript_27678/g.89404  ORF Transcript_27678/g.89404 Transcript_27678/m.89404 type:complete len:471 (-) Transcript_27678:1443-2855(-)